VSFAELWRELEPLGRDPGTGGHLVPDVPEELSRSIRAVLG
jgi:hypothetical protein